MSQRENYHSKESQNQRTTAIPSNVTMKENSSNHSPSIRKQTALEKAKALYGDYEDAFQDDTTNHDYFGYQPKAPPENSQEPSGFYLQSVQTVCEVNNLNPSPLLRYHGSRENSLPSTSSDTSSPNASQQDSNYHQSNSNSLTKINGFISRLNLTESNDDDDTLPPPFTPESIRIEIKPNQYDDSLDISSEFKLILPQYFLVKYLGRKPCKNASGTLAVRDPIDEMVQNARKLSSISQLPTLEVCVNMRGLALMHRPSLSRAKSEQQDGSSDRQHGLIPLEYISYVMHDIKYCKISACIVLRQTKTPSSEKKIQNNTVTECYTFLFQSKEHAHRFALSLSEAFNTQKRSTRTATNNYDYRKEESSPQRRRKYQMNHHDRIRANKYDDSYLRDSDA